MGKDDRSAEDLMLDEDAVYARLLNVNVYK